MTTPTPAHLAPTTSARGFALMPEIITERGERVQVYESSAADGPHVWLSVEGVTAHMSLDELSRLVEQAQHLIANHYQNS